MIVKCPVKCSLSKCWPYEISFRLLRACGGVQRVGQEETAVSYKNIPV